MRSSGAISAKFNIGLAFTVPRLYSLDHLDYLPPGRHNVDQGGTGHFGRVTGRMLDGMNIAVRRGWGRSAFCKLGI
jgi:hypothetical protein